MPGACLSEVVVQQRCGSTPSDLDPVGKRAVADNVSLMVRHPSVILKGMSDWFDVAYVESNSQGVSDTVIAYGMVRKVPGCDSITALPVVIKIFITEVDPVHQAHTAGLMYESAVYSCVVANMTSVPFFAFPYAVFTKPPCLEDAFERKMCELLPWRETQQTLRGDNVARVRCTVMEYCGACRLVDEVETCDGPSFVQLSLQMLAALKTMQENHVTHNDLHWGNVLVKKDSPPFFMDSMTGKVVNAAQRSCVAIDRGNLIKIFDWDHAVSQRTKDNKKTHIHGHTTKSFKKMYDTIGFLKKWFDVIAESPNRRTPENIVINTKCIEAYYDTIFRLASEYPWAFHPGKGAFLQHACLPITDSRQNPNPIMEYEDDCEDTWPADMDARFEQRVEMFTQRLAHIVLP
jgi:hypothetical protein